MLAWPTASSPFAIEASANRAKPCFLFEQRYLHFLLLPFPIPRVAGLDPVNRQLQSGQSGALSNIESKIRILSTLLLLSKSARGGWWMSPFKARKSDACAAMLELFRGQPDSPERAREISALLSNQHHAFDAKIRIRSDDIRRVSELGEVA